jgi:CRP/FNR family cyclic AMP-dependent transcriptional regulator
MADRRLLDRSELFAALPEDLLATLRDLAVERTYERGEVVFEQGAPAAELYLLEEGRIAITTVSNDGRDSVVAVMEDGALFGELGLFDEEPRSADARVLAPTILTALAYEPVRTALQAHPASMWAITRVLAQRLRATDEALNDAVFLDVPARTAKRLLELAGEQDAFQIALTQEELAGLVGASRERVNKALSTFVRLGWIEIEGRGSYRILDRESLTLRANP